MSSLLETQYCDAQVRDLFDDLMESLSLYAPQLNITEKLKLCMQIIAGMPPAASSGARFSVDLSACGQMNDAAARQISVALASCLEDAWKIVQTTVVSRHPSHRWYFFH